MSILQIDTTVINVHRDILSKLELSVITDSPIILISLIKEAALEIQVLRDLAEDLYVTVANELGSTTAGKNYQEYLQNI
jgi:hypothetical protein